MGVGRVARAAVTKGRPRRPPRPGPQALPPPPSSPPLRVPAPATRHAYTTPTATTANQRPPLRAPECTPPPPSPRPATTANQRSPPRPFPPTTNTANERLPPRPGEPRLRRYLQSSASPCGSRNAHQGLQEGRDLRAYDPVQPGCSVFLLCTC
ncbi:PREDICTED: alpha carbonic anhydrase 8-like [Rhinopithecus bieti]|uniref:alpha carbonic anhydrase 8-like n=1 Tax=Rhinopithecus bieti TaxID=61621 RepID=UPI00083BD696|nr:PREDICTED: alpha carbonic anhydrase 8-like [Rhinopithecus bieti]